MDLKALLVVQGVIVTTCLATFVAARQLAPEPSASSPSASSSSSSLCSRALATTLWGAVFAFFSLMADYFLATQVAARLTGDDSLSVVLFIMWRYIPYAPLFGIFEILKHLFTTLRFRQILRGSTNPDTMSMSNKLRRDIDDILAILFGINQPRGFLKSTRIVANNYIVLGMSDSITVPSSHIDSAVNEYDMNVALTDALTLGHKTAGNSCLMLLNESGKLALLKTSILPNHAQLRFLDARSGIATIIIGVQAIGYVTSIVYRAIHHLPVSPIEAIGFAFTMLVIVRSVVHSLGVICQTPLLIYLNPTQEQEMLHQCESTRWSNEDGAICENAAMVGMVVVGSLVVAFTVLVENHVLRISWLDAIGPILFLLSLIAQLFSIIIVYKYSDLATCGVLFFYGIVMISHGGIVVSVVATIGNWQTNKFDIRTPSVIHNLPFLG
jgi:hypothetical protein